MPLRNPLSTPSSRLPAPLTLSPTLVSHAYGIAAGSSLPTLDEQQLVARLDGISATGAKWVRLDIDWSQVQPSNSHGYSWGAYDRIIDAANTRHLQILAILDYTPAWARPANCQDSSHCAPADPAAFATFARTAAEHYHSRGVHYWEVWNEPNNRDFWQPATSPTAYAALLRASYASLHGADPQAWVITAGLSPQATADGAYAPYDFLAALYDAGISNAFDAVGNHPYTFPLSPTSNENHAWNQMAAATHSLRSLMVEHGDAAKKIWITEFGAPTGGPGPVSTLRAPNLEAHPYVVDQAAQAKILSDALALYHTYSWAGPFFYYTYQDPGTDPSTNENFFGLVTADGTKKPAYQIFHDAAMKP